jgi:FKBP-type peptidyl-prolyl cis-trans isomerase SlyD
LTPGPIPYTVRGYAFENRKEQTTVMTIQDKAFVEIEYALTLDSGEVVDQSTPGNPLGFIFGAGQIIPGLEQKLLGMSSGESAKLVVEPADGYGERNEELVRVVPRKFFPEGMDVEPDMIFQASTAGGPATLRVIEVTDEGVKADFNHPMAGQRLTFDVKVSDVREATAEELKALETPHSHDGCGGGCSCSS